MSEPLTPELEARALELAARITARSADTLMDMARRLVTSTDDNPFGHTEFALRDSALGLVADAYAEYLPKKAGTPPPPSTAPTADAVPPTTGIAPRPSTPSAVRPSATARTTTAARAAQGRARGTGPSD